MSISAKVQQRLARIRKGAPFSIKSFYSLGAETAVQKALSRLASSGKVVRLARGIYVRPKPLKLIPGVQTLSNPTAVARHWAKTRHFKIAEQGEEAAYRLGLQTQAPMKKILWCTGPSRTFHVSNATVEVKHVSKGKLRWLNKPEGILFRGLSILNAKLVNIEQLTTAFSRLNLSSSQIETALRKLKAELSSEWTGKLNQLSGGMR